MSWLATFALVIPDPVERKSVSLSWKNTEVYLRHRAWKFFSYVNESQFPPPARSIYHILFFIATSDLCFAYIWTHFCVSHNY